MFGDTSPDFGRRMDDAGCIGVCRAQIHAMNDSRVMSKSQKLDEIGNGKRTAIIFAAVLVLFALVGVLAFAFRGRHIRQNAAAMVAPGAGTLVPATSGSAAAGSPPAH